MSIWKNKLTPDEAREFSRDTMVEYLGMQIVDIGEDSVTATMPVDHRTRQPYGLLHGGASVALAETVGSFAAHMTLDPGYRCVGLEINANHLRSKTEGMVTGTARPIHIGHSTQIWDIRIADEADRLICVSRLTLAVLKP